MGLPHANFQQLSPVASISAANDYTVCIIAFMGGFTSANVIRSKEIVFYRDFVGDFPHVVCFAATSLFSLHVGKRRKTFCQKRVPS